MRVAVLALLACASCLDAPAPQDLPRAELAPFVDQAQPVLEARCANPSCHGTGERPLAVFAVRRYRLDAGDTHVDAPLTDEELRLNLLRAALFTVDVPHARDSLLLVKPLSGHADVDVFTSAEEYDYRRLEAWVDEVLRSRGADPSSGGQAR